MSLCINDSPLLSYRVMPGNTFIIQMRRPNWHNTFTSTQSCLHERVVAQRESKANRLLDKQALSGQHEVNSYGLDLDFGSLLGASS